MINIYLFILILILIFLNSKNPFNIFNLIAFVTLPAAFSSIDEVKYILLLGLVFSLIGAISFRYIFPSRDLNVDFNSFTINTYSIYTLFIIYSLFSSFYFYKIGIPLFDDHVGLTRLTQRHAVPGSYFFQRVFRIGMPMLIIMYFISLKQHNSSKKMILFFMIFSNVLFLLFTGIRANVISFILFPFLITYFYINSNVDIKKLFTISFFGLITVFLSTYYMYETSDLSLLLRAIIERISGAATDGITYAVLFDIPANGFYFGSTWLNDILSIFSKLNIINSSHQNYSAYIASMLLGSLYNGEQAAVTIFGEFYVNFGFAGVCLFSYLFGIFLSFLMRIPFNFKYTVSKLSALIIFISSFSLIVGGPFITMLFDYFLTVLFFWFVYVVFSRLLRRMVWISS